MVAISQPRIDLFSAETITLEDILSIAEYSISSERNKIAFAEKTEQELSKPGKKNYLALGAALAMLGRYTQAIETLEKAGDNKEKFLELAFCLRKSDLYDKTVAALDKAAKAGADALLVNCSKASIYRLKGDFKSAEEMIKACGNYAKASALYHYTVGRCLDTQGDYEQAIENYKTAVEIDPTFRKALFHLAYLLDIRGDEEAAIDYYKQLINNCTPYVSALLNLAVLYEDTNQYDKATACIDQVLKYHPNNQRAIIFKKDIESSKTMLYDEEIEKSKDRQSKVLETPISDFELSVRSRNCLKKMNINSLGDLLKTTEAELLAYKNFGETSLSEIKHMLDSKGLRLGMTAEGKFPIEIQMMGPQEAQADIDKEISSKSMDDFEMSIRARNCLMQLNIKTIGDLISRTEAEMLGVKNFGVTSLTEIKQVLDSLGLGFRKID
jgi:DNA-directed RNA polymerase subunit alpha